MAGVIAVPVANLYATPHEESEVVSQALYGWVVEKLNEVNDFVFVRAPNQYEGWILKKEFLPSTPSKGKLAKIIHNAAHVYIEPSVKKQRPLITLPFEVFLKVKSEPSEEDFRWIEVELMDGKSGWIHRANVQLDALPLSLRQMLNLSKQFLGLPYTWGGLSSFGYDCSGYIQMLFRQMNIHLPRDAKPQMYCSLCQEITLDDLEEGDLLFFGTSEEAIKHVALYLGHGEIIHASVKPIPLVQQISLKESQLNRFPFWSARRINSA